MRVDFDYTAAPANRNQQNRGVSGFVRITWDEALKIINSEIARIKSTYGLNSVLVFADGHGQASVLNQVHGYAHGLFLECLGGETSVVRNPDSWEGWYYGLRHFWGFPGPGGDPDESAALDDILANGSLMITSADPETMTSGSPGHTGTLLMMWLRQAGLPIIWVTPELNYTAAAHMYWVNGGKWIPILPNTDAALYLAIAYTWINEGTYDNDYLSTHTVGFDETTLPTGAPAGSAHSRDYVMGLEDGIPKTPKWAENITAIPARTIKALARQWASNRTSYMNYFGGGRSGGRIQPSQQDWKWACWPCKESGNREFNASTMVLGRYDHLG